MSDDAGALADIVDVSRETIERLTVYVDLLDRWQKAQNLVAPGTLDDVWRRHVADSAQLAAIYPDPAVWADLGSGAGFPGLVTAILMAEKGAGEVVLVESNRRKCAFLRQVIRATGARATVAEGRIETVLPPLAPRIERISARAVAPLADLLALANPLFLAGATAAFHKGQDFVLEIDQASKYWVFDLIKHESRVGVGSVILEIANVRPTAESRLKKR